MVIGKVIFRAVADRIYFLPLTLFDVKNEIFVVLVSEENVSELTTNFKGHDHIYQGSYGQGTYESYLKINSLPTLANGDMIVNVTLNQFLDDQGFFDTSFVGLYETKSSWSESTITWSNKPDLEEALIDADFVILLNRFNEKVSSSVSVGGIKTLVSSSGNRNICSTRKGNHINNIIPHVKRDKNHRI